MNNYAIHKIPSKIFFPAAISYFGLTGTWCSKPSFIQTSQFKTKKQKNQEKNKKKSYSVTEAPNNTAITWKIAADPNTKSISFKTWTICKMTNKMIIHIVYGIYEVLLK